MDYAEGYRPDSEEAALRYFRHAVLEYREASLETGARAKQLRDAESAEDKARTRFIQARVWLEKWVAGEGDLVGSTLDPLHAWTSS